jgi:hypothetical protein
MECQKVLDKPEVFMPGMCFLLPAIGTDTDNVNIEEINKNNSIKQHKINISNACRRSERVTSGREVTLTDQTSDKKTIKNEMSLLENSDLIDIFPECCGIPGVNIELLKLIYDKISNKTDLLKSQHCFYASCINSNLDVMMWQNDLMIKHKIKPTPSAKITDTLGSYIYHGCGGKLVAFFYDNHFYEKPKHEQLFVYTCANDSTQTAEWLVKNFDIDIHAEDDLAFVFCCLCGATKTAKWLYEYSKTNHKKDIVIDNHNAFNGAICYGDVELVEFLYNLHPKCFDIYDIKSTSGDCYGNDNDDNDNNNDNYMYVACYNLNLDVVIWLYEKYKSKGIKINDLISQNDFDGLNSYFNVKHMYEMYVIDWLLEVSDLDGNSPYIYKSKY